MVRNLRADIAELEAAKVSAADIDNFIERMIELNEQVMAERHAENVIWRNIQSERRA